MNKQELKKAHCIKMAVDGKMTVAQAAQTLSLSTRRIKQLKSQYRKKGVSACIHGNRGKRSPKKTNELERQRIVELRKQHPYAKANYTHFMELANATLEMSLGYQTVRRICIEEKLFSPKKQKARKAKHKTRARKMSPGMMLQVDGSPHDWLWNGKPITLHGFIDDATSMITGLYFATNECLYGYLEVMRQTLLNFGIPMSLYPDRYSVFFYNPKKQQELSIEEQLAGNDKHITQFGRIVQDLGIDMFPAHSPQAKGRIERLWQTLQSRLIIELQLAHIKTMDEANKFLPNFIKRFNKQFSKTPSCCESAFAPITAKQVDEHLFACFTRKIDNGGVISFKNIKFRADNNNLPRKATIQVLIDFKHGFRGRYKKEIFNLIPLDENNNEILDTDESNMPIVLKEFLEKLFFADAKTA